MNRLEETTKQICENGDLTHDYAVNLAKMVDARTEEIKRLTAKLEQAEKALEEIEDESSHEDTDVTRVNGIAQDTLAFIRS